MFPQYDSFLRGTYWDFPKQRHSLIKHFHNVNENFDTEKLLDEEVNCVADRINSSKLKKRDNIFNMLLKHNIPFTRLHSTPEKQVTKTVENPKSILKTQGAPSRAKSVAINTLNTDYRIPTPTIPQTNPHHHNIKIQRKIPIIYPTTPLGANRV